MKTLKKSLPLIIVLVLFAALAYAQIPGQPITMDKIRGYLDTAANWLFFVLAGLAVIYIVLAGFYYLTSEGDPEKVSKAHSRLIYALIAFGVGLIAKGITYIVIEFLGV